jgi:fucose 4-O-acetylase-like acetyltransferase
LSNRINYMDIIKALAIIVVVIGHSGSPHPIYNIIYLYHMPLFFFISGYFYKNEYSNNISLLIKKRIKSLYIPFLAYEVLFLWLHNTFFKLNIYNDVVGFKNSVEHLYSLQDMIDAFRSILLFQGTETLLGAFWFIPTLFAVNILFGIISKVVKNNEHKRMSIIFIMFIIGNLISVDKIQVGELTNHYFGIALVALTIFYCGYLFKNYEGKISYNVNFLFVAISFLILSSLYGTLEISSQNYVNPSFIILCSLTGIYLNIFVAKKIMESNIKINVLKFIGANSLTIMALHFLCFKLVSIMQIEVYHLPLYMLGKFPVIDGSNGWWILYTIFGVLLPVGLAYSINKILATCQKKFLRHIDISLNYFVLLTNTYHLKY